MHKYVPRVHLQKLDPVMAADLAASQRCGGTEIGANVAAAAAESTPTQIPQQTDREEGIEEVNFIYFRWQHRLCCSPPQG